MIPVFIFPDNGNRIVMAPVNAEVSVGRYGPVIFIGRCRAYRQGQRIGLVIRVKGNAYACCRIFCPYLVVCSIHACSVIHTVVGNT